MYDALMGQTNKVQSGGASSATMPTHEEGSSHSPRDRACACDTDDPARGKLSSGHFLKMLKQYGNRSIADSGYMSRDDTCLTDSCNLARGSTCLSLSGCSSHDKLRNPRCVTRPSDDKINLSEQEVCDGTNMHDSRDLDGLCDHLESVEMTDGPFESDKTSLPINVLLHSGNHGRLSPEIAELFRFDEDGDTLLHSAIITGNEQLARVIINMAPSWRWLNIQNRLKQSPLHLAVLTEQTSVVRRLIAGGADITARDTRGDTPLHLACHEGHLVTVQTLMEPVRYPETKQNSYDLPYQRIPQNLQIVNYEGLSAIHLAVLCGHADIVKLLIENQADINCGDVKSGRSVLHMACEMGNLEIVTLLLKYKSCKINARTYSGLTPFDLARDREHARITYELAVAGANYDEESDMDEY